MGCAVGWRDGATEFETLYEQHLATPLGPEVVSLVDFWHAAEYLRAGRDDRADFDRSGRGL